MNKNPYASPNAADSPTAASRPEIERHWFAVHVTAWAMIGISGLNLLTSLGTVIAVARGTVSLEEIDRPMGLLLVPGFAVITLVGAFGALQRKRWGVGLLAVMTFIQCCLAMIFGLGDSFSACWRSFDASPPMRMGLT
jgi:hypothetical protein